MRVGRNVDRTIAVAMATVGCIGVVGVAGDGSRAVSVAAGRRDDEDRRPDAAAALRRGRRGRARQRRLLHGERKALVEGGGYTCVWLETQPMGGAMYGKRDLEVALNNQLIFMDCQRADGRLPGVVVSSKETRAERLGQGRRTTAAGNNVPAGVGVAAYFAAFSGYCFPSPALDVYYLIGRDRKYLGGCTAPWKPTTPICGALATRTATASWSCGVSSTTARTTAPGLPARRTVGRTRIRPASIDRSRPKLRELPHALPVDGRDGLVLRRPPRAGRDLGRIGQWTRGALAAEGRRGAETLDRLALAAGEARLLRSRQGWPVHGRVAAQQPSLHVVSGVHAGDGRRIRAVSTC